MLASFTRWCFKSPVLLDEHFLWPHGILACESHQLRIICYVREGCCLWVSEQACFWWNLWKQSSYFIIDKIAGLIPAVWPALCVLSWIAVWPFSGASAACSLSTPVYNLSHKQIFDVVKIQKVKAWMYQAYCICVYCIHTETMVKYVLLKKWG